VLLRAWIQAIRFPLCFAPPRLGAIFACSLSIDSQASTAGNSPRAHNFNCTEPPASGNDLLWFLLLQQLFLTTKKDNKPPSSISPTAIPNVPHLCQRLWATREARPRGGGPLARQSEGLALPSTLPDNILILTAALQSRGREPPGNWHHNRVHGVNVTL